MRLVVLNMKEERYDTSADCESIEQVYLGSMSLCV